MNKKVMSLLLSILMLVSMLVPFSAFAGIKNDELKKQVEADLADEIEYLNFTPSLAKAASSQMLFKVDTSKKHGFLTELATNLVQNDGKIVVNGSENAIYYAVAINILDMLGEDYTDFKGYNLEELFVNCTATTIPNRYYVMHAAEAAKTIGNDELAKQYISQVANDTVYEMGKGMENYGYYSPDDNAMFLATVGLYPDDFKEYVDDAKKLVESARTDKGYDNGWGSTSASTTACALRAYSVLGDEEKATDAYMLLVNNFESPENNGVMQYEGEDNEYETSQAFSAIAYYKDLFAEDNADDPSETPDTKDNDKKADSSKKDDTKSETKKDSSAKSPATGVTALGFASIGLGAVLVASSRKKRD